MAWSTRQVAELAGTTLKAVRHYHKLGLLEEPERDTNGYKRYGVAHLVRLLRIRRLTDLGVPLAQIAAMGDADEHPEEALRVLDAELGATIERLQRVRAELAIILRQNLPTDLPAELAPATDDMSEADRALMVVYSRVLSPEGIDAWQRMLTDYKGDPTAEEFDALPEDADEEARRGLTERYFPHVIELYARYPDVLTSQLEAPRGAEHLSRTIGLAMSDIYNDAQLDVLDRIGTLLNERAKRIQAAKNDDASGG